MQFNSIQAPSEVEPVEKRNPKPNPTLPQIHSLTLNQDPPVPSTSDITFPKSSLVMTAGQRCTLQPCWTRVCGGSAATVTPRRSILISAATLGSSFVRRGGKQAHRGPENLTLGCQTGMTGSYFSASRDWRHHASICFYLVRDWALVIPTGTALR